MWLEQTSRGACFCDGSADDIQNSLSMQRTNDPPSACHSIMKRGSGPIDVPGGSRMNEILGSPRSRSRTAPHRTQPGVVGTLAV